MVRVFVWRQAVVEISITVVNLVQPARLDGMTNVAICALVITLFTFPNAITKLIMPDLFSELKFTHRGCLYLVVV